MTCVICQHEIKPHVPQLHDLQVNAERTVSICDTCCEKLMKWQGERIARLFPTQAMKRMQRRGSGS